jgi:hypothetical protein
MIVKEWEIKAVNEEKHEETTLAGHAVNSIYQNTILVNKPSLVKDKKNLRGRIGDKR